MRPFTHVCASNPQMAWVVGDTVYGSARSLRAALEERRQAYALAVTCKEHVEVQGTRRRVDQVAGSLTEEDWQILSVGVGSKGPRLFVWARIELLLDCVITSAEALSLLIYNCRTKKRARSAS
ncbi:hypothetical protein ccbrp13_17020 [Ktedonobacteria bacterium brp13]|nr:hypothetical protein ccbrp13_17020 [Ktedonobacteria bacterium brp13]